MRTLKTLLGGSCVFHFEKRTGPVSGDATAVLEVRVPAGSPVAAALAANSTIPAGEIKLGAIGVGAGGGKRELRFRSGAEEVRFAGGAGAHSGFGVYPSSDSLRADLDPSGEYLHTLELPGGGVARFLALRRDYGLRASAAGSVALGCGGSVHFGGRAGSEGFLAVIRAFNKEPKARDAFEDAIANWKLPREIESPEALSPGTWVVAEVEGRFALRLGAQFGYDFNWVRKLRRGGLTGDAGLRIQTAVDATIGVEASGRYLIAVARESMDPVNRRLRIRLFKASNKGWNFVLNTRTSATGDTGRFLPAQRDDLIASIFGTHGPQLIEDLKKFREWTDPETPLAEKFTGFLLRYAGQHIDDLDGNRLRRLAEARRRVAEFLKSWDQLPHRLASLLWSETRRAKRKPSPLERDLAVLARANRSAIRRYLEQASASAGFFRTPLGAWIENAVSGSLLSALSEDVQVDRIGDVARLSLELLTSSVLRELSAFAEEGMRVGALKNVADMAQFRNLEPWLQDRIRAFLDGTVTGDKIKKLRRTLHILESNTDKFYSAGVKALNATYRSACNYTYANSSSHTALVDITFDFNENPDLGSLVRSLLRGDFRDLLRNPYPGVSLRRAALTHGIRRQSHLELTLPFGGSKSLDHLNESLARMEVVEDGGRLFAYDVNAADVRRDENKWRSSLMIAGGITVGAGTGIRAFREEQAAAWMNWSYSLRQAIPRMRLFHLEERVRALIPWYFPRTFGGVPAQWTASLAEWLKDLDRQSEAVLNHGTGDLGNALLSLEVSLPGLAAAAWLKAPVKSRSRALRRPYMEMSRAIQRVMRRLIPYCYFVEPDRYVAARLPIAANVLLYQCLPVTTSIRTSGTTLRLNTDNDFYWDYRDPKQRRAMVYCAVTRRTLRGELERVHRLLEDNPPLRRWAGVYTPRALEEIPAKACPASSRGFLTTSLLRSEAIVIEEARKAGYAIAAFRDNAAGDPERALEALARFGRKITATFNKKLNGLFGGEISRTLGSLVFLEAARALDPALAATHPSAILELTLLKESAPRTWRGDFFKGQETDPEHIALRQTIVSGS